MTPDEKKYAAGDPVTWKRSEARPENEVFKRRETLTRMANELLTGLEMAWEREGLGAFAHVNVKIVAHDDDGRETQVEGSFGRAPVRAEVKVGPTPADRLRHAWAIDDNLFQKAYRAIFGKR